METIKQEPGSKDCLACVAAMATDTPVLDYKRFCKRNELLISEDLAFVQYLWHCGFMDGIYFGDDGVYSVVTIEQLEEINLLHGPAYLVVESANEEVREQGASHAVYWDGKIIHDPNPDWTPRKGPYKIISVRNITKNASHPRWNKQQNGEQFE